MTAKIISLFGDALNACAESAASAAPTVANIGMERESARLKKVAENHHVGSKYEETKHLRAKDIAKLIRKDVKAAVKAGELPEGLKVSVRTRRSTHSDAIDVEVKAAPGITINSIERLAYEREHGPYAPSPHKIRSEAAYALLEALRAIVNAYNFDKSDTMTDYFHVRFYDHVGFDCDLVRTDRERIEAALEAKATREDAAEEETNAHEDYLAHLGAM